MAAARAAVLAAALFTAILQSTIVGAAQGGATVLGRERGASVDHSTPFERSTALSTSQAAIGRVLGDYRFHDANGKERRLSSWRGRPLVISLIYTQCHHICPTTTRHLAQVVANARGVLGEQSFAVITVGFDTPNDTVEAMRDFARAQGVNWSGWDFLSGDETTMREFAAALGFQYVATGGGFNHLLQTTLVDADGKIRRQVYGMEFDAPLLVEPLKGLVFGTEMGSSFLAELVNRIRLFCTVYDPAAERYRFDYSIFVGLATGLTIGGLCVWALLGEWRRSSARSRQ